MAASVPERPTLTAEDAPAAWRGEPGTAYAARNPTTAEGIDESYRQRFGTTRTELVRRFLRDVPRDAAILEVGCSAGPQLAVLRAAGYTRLYGVDVAAGAVRHCPEPACVADGFALPFRDRAFDLVYTSGTLMHVFPSRRPAFCAELLRVTRRWVWGFELWSDPPAAWSFGGLIPRAWALPEPCSFEGLPLRTVDTQHFTNAVMKHVMYLLVRA